METTKSIRVIGDVHGHVSSLQQAVEGADSIVLLGDLVDRGPDSPGCLRLALDLLDQGRARLVRSNHDDKLFRALKGNQVRTGPALEKTLADLSAATDSTALIQRFLQTFPSLPFVTEVGRYAMAHGAISAGFFAPPPGEEAQDNAAPHMALYGQVDGSFDKRGRPIRRYEWVDDIPEGRTAIVGHDRRDNNRIYIQSGKLGGRAIFLDTGCGKGGPLSFIDIPAETTGQIASA